MMTKRISVKLLCMMLAVSMICGTCCVFASDTDAEVQAEAIGDGAAAVENADESEVFETSAEDAQDIGEAGFDLLGEADIMAVDTSGWVKVSDGKPIFASAYTAGKEAYRATDGDASTSFVSAKQNLGKGVEDEFGKMNERLVIDLLEKKTIAGIKIMAASDCGDDVLIYAGNDNEFNTKDKIYEGSVSDSEMSVIEASAVTVGKEYRYIIVEKNDYTKFAISEIEVYSTEESSAVDANVRRVSYGKTTYANNRGGYAGLNLKDNPVYISSETYLSDSALGSDASFYYFVDLGAEYEVPYITMSAGIWRYGNSDTTNVAYRAARSDFEIIGTNDPNFASSTANDVLLYKYDGEFGAKSTYGSGDYIGVDSGMALFENKDHKTEKFRYIGIRRPKTSGTERIVLSTFNVYAGGIMVENMTASKSGTSGLSVSADITGLDTDGLTALVSVFDEKGDCIGTKASEISFSGNDKYEFSGGGDFGGEITSASLVLVEDLEDFDVRWYNLGLLGGKGEMPTPVHTAGDDADNKNFTVKNDGQKVYIYGSAKYDFLTAMIIKPTGGETPITFDNLSVSNYDSSVLYAKSYETVKDEPYEFAADLGASADIGTYYVKLFYPDGTSENVYDFYYFSETENETLTGLLDGAEAGDVLTTMRNDKYKEAFKDCEAEIEKCGEEDFGEYFVKAREIMKSGEYGGTAVTFTDYTQFKDVVKFASMLHSLIERSDYADYITKYKSVYMSGVFDKNYDADKFAAIYPTVRSNEGEFKTNKQLSDCIKKTIALGLVYNGSQNDIKKAITDYAEYIGINASVVSDSGYTAFEIAQYIPKTLTDVKGYAQSGMQSAVESAIKKVKAANKKNTSSHVGGGSSGISNKTYEEPVEIPEAKKEITVSFSDLSGFEWAESAILNLADKKIIKGDGSGAFKPNDNITREEVVKLVVEMFEITTKQSDDLFDDCSVTDWYYPYVMAAKYNKVVKGVSENSFGAGRAVTRQDLATILRRAMTFAKYDFAGSASVSFTDEDDVDMYALDGVLTLASEGIINGFDDGSFRPRENTTRAEAAVMFDRVYEKYQKQQIALKAASEEE